MWLVDGKGPRKRELSFTKSTVTTFKLLLNRMKVKDVHQSYTALGEPTLLDILDDIKWKNCYCKQIIAILEKLCTPRSFLCAVYTGDTELVVQLLNNGDDIGTNSYIGENALHLLAWGEESLRMYKLLLNHPAMTKEIINELDREEKTPLDAVYCWNQSVEKDDIIALLKKKGGIRNVMCDEDNHDKRSDVFD